SSLLALSSFPSMTRSPPRPTLFPYTTLFRSAAAKSALPRVDRFLDDPRPTRLAAHIDRQLGAGHRLGNGHVAHPDANVEHRRVRSEEHTSELQSRFDLVCRLLLEKKKNPKQQLGHTESLHHVRSSPRPNSGRVPDYLTSDPLGVLPRALVRH